MSITCMLLDMRRRYFSALVGKVLRLRVVQSEPDLPVCGRIRLRPFMPHLRDVPLYRELRREWLRNYWWRRGVVRLLRLAALPVPEPRARRALPRPAPCFAELPEEFEEVPA